MRLLPLFGGAVVLLVSLTLPNVSAAEMTSAQLKEVDATVQALEKACLANTALKDSQDAVLRNMGQWISSPEVCGCQARNLRQALTPAVLSMGQEEKKDFFLRFSLTKGAECTVPAIKTNMSASCEDVFGSLLKSVPAEDLNKKLQSHGFVNAEAYLSQTCGCIRHSLSEITTDAWVQGSVSAYNNYRERMRTGDQSIKAPATPFDGVIKQCLVSLTTPLYPPALLAKRSDANQSTAMRDVPAGWETKPLTERQSKGGIVLSLYSQTLDASLIMSVAKRTDYPDSAAFAASRRTALASKMQNPHFSEITSLKINGKAAWRFEATGDIGGIAVTYLTTIVENANSMNMVLLWTSPANYATQREALVNTSDNVAAPPA